ncbi:MAG: ParB N-terminal domain-containing protein [Bradyrhizobiaceae bacterium]|nr:ParB N-terminal domain-containing protein [Bradyrhizobiaceae bacterium]
MNNRIEVRDLRLKFVEAEAVLLHEQTDTARVDRLTRSVTEDGFLRNPPIVAPAGDGQWVVLDGATRTTMLKNLGARHIPVQCVEYDSDSVTLHAWYHVLPASAALEAGRFAADHQAEITVVESVAEARTMLDNRQGIAALVHENGTCSVFVIPSTTFGTPFGVLRALVEVYGGAGEIYRIVHNDLVEIVRTTEACPEVIMFPTFTPQDIQLAAVTGDLLPAGITRHLISGRALNLNIDISVVLNGSSISEKNSWLRSWLTSKILAKKVRYYHEPVFVFDD